MIPDKKIEPVQFCESHWPIWTANAGAIELSAAQTKNVEHIQLRAWLDPENNKPRQRAGLVVLDSEAKHLALHLLSLGLGIVECANVHERAFVSTVPHLLLRRRVQAKREQSRRGAKG